MMSNTNFKNGQRKLSTKFSKTNSKKVAAGAALLATAAMQGCNDPVKGSVCNPMQLVNNTDCASNKTKDNKTTHCAPAAATLPQMLDSIRALYNAANGTDWAKNLNINSTGCLNNTKFSEEEWKKFMALPAPLNMTELAKKFPQFADDNNANFWTSEYLNADVLEYIGKNFDLQTDYTNVSPKNGTAYSSSWTKDGMCYEWAPAGNKTVSCTTYQDCVNLTNTTAFNASQFNETMSMYHCSFESKDAQAQATGKCVRKQRVHDNTTNATGLRCVGPNSVTLDSFCDNNDHAAIKENATGIMRPLSEFVGAEGSVPCTTNLHCDKQERCLRDKASDVVGACGSLEKVQKGDEWRISPNATTLDDLKKQKVKQQFACDMNTTTHNYTVPAGLDSFHVCKEQNTTVTDINNNTYVVSSVVARPSKHHYLEKHHSDVVAKAAEKGLLFKAGMPYLQQECQTSANCGGESYCKESVFEWQSFDKTEQHTFEDLGLKKAIKALDKNSVSQCQEIKPAVDVRTEVETFLQYETDDFECDEMGISVLFSADINTPVEEEKSQDIDDFCVWVKKSGGEKVKKCEKKCVKSFKKARDAKLKEFFQSNGQWTLDVDIEGKVVSSGWFARTSQ
jgi:hypothetical protein